uniref:Uncharacterized protein n=1 Tax=Lactuca sativa TaxID=4236 RepID=A0A9R1WBG7_LACSA|nr:hypothetical protein LSAT_V11C200094950 [Lactuca sativa]
MRGTKFYLWCWNLIEPYCDQFLRLYDVPQAEGEKAYIHLAFRRVERQSSAIRKIGDVEIERKSSTPNGVKTKKDGPIEVKLKDKVDNLSMNTGDGGNMIPSFLQHMPMAYPDCSTAMPSVVGSIPAFMDRSLLLYNLVAGKTSFIGTDNLQIKDFVVYPEYAATHGQHLRYSTVVLGNPQSMILQV